MHDTYTYLTCFPSISWVRNMPIGLSIRWTIYNLCGLTVFFVAVTKDQLVKTLKSCAGKPILVLLRLTDRQNWYIDLWKCQFACMWAHLGYCWIVQKFSVEFCREQTPAVVAQICRGIICCNHAWSQLLWNLTMIYLKKHFRAPSYMGMRHKHVPSFSWPFYSLMAKCTTLKRILK